LRQGNQACTLAGPRHRWPKRGLSGMPRSSLTGRTK
jgi:hypothetical protein